MFFHLLIKVDVNIAHVVGVAVEAEVGQIFKFKFSQIFKDEKMKFSHNREAGTW